MHNFTNEALAEVLDRCFARGKTLKIDNKNRTKNRIPKNFRKSKINQETKDLIVTIRLDNPAYSKKKIEIILLRDYNIKLSHTTIEKQLKAFNKKV